MATKSNTATAGTTPSNPRKRATANPPVGLAIDATTADVHTFDVLKSAVFGDGSKFAPNAWVELPALIETTVNAVSPWYKAYSDEMTQSELLGKTDLAIRKLHLRADGQSDWAGLTFAYRESTEKRFDAACIAAGMDLATKKGRTARSKLVQKIREYRSFNKLTPLAIAVDLVTNDKDLAAQTVRVGAVERTYEELIATAATGVATDLPVPMQKKIREVYQTQTDLDGKRAKGFADTDVPKTLGDKRKRVGTTTKTPSNTPGTGWDQSRADLANKAIDQKKLGAETLQTITAWSDRVLGKPSEPAIELSASDAKIALNLTEAMQKLIDTTVAALRPDDSATRDAVKPFRLEVSKKK